MLLKIFLVIILSVTFCVPPSDAKQISKIDTMQANPETSNNCDWPMFGRTPDGNRVAPDECGPKGDKVRLKWKWEPYIGAISSDLTVVNGLIYAGSFTGKMYCIRESDRTKVWEFQTGGKVISSPILEYEKIYFGSNDCKFYCLDALSGRKLWEFKTKGASTPSVFNGKVYFGSNDSMFYCLDANTGTKVWEYETGGSFNGSPAISNGRVYFGLIDGKLYCIDANTGAKVWQYETGGSFNGSPAISNGRVYFGLIDGKLYCIDANTGAKVWQYETGGSFNGSPAISNGRVYFGLIDGKLYCIDANTGAKVWQYETGGPFNGSPAISNGRVYFGLIDGKLYCIDANTGAKVWQYETGGPFNGSPAISNGRVYFGLIDGKLYCIDANTGAKVWQYETGGSFNGSPAISNGRVYIGSDDNKLYCMDASTGVKIWEYETGGSIYDSPAISNGRVYFGSADNKLYCLDSGAGAKVWEYETEGSINDSPAISNGRVYFGSADNKLHCLDAETGAKLWENAISGRITSTSAISNSRVYIGSDDNKLYCMDAGTGVKIWEYETGGSIYDSPAISNGRVYFGSNDKRLYCLDAGTGIKIWEYQLSSNVDILNTPAISDNRVYFGSPDNIFYCLDNKYGTKIWEYKTSEFIYSSPAISNNRIYFASDNMIHCLDVDKGTKVWGHQTEFITRSSTIISNNRILFSSNFETLYCLETYSETTDDTTPPIIRIINPPENGGANLAETLEFQIEFSVSDDSGLSSVTLNGMPVSLNEKNTYIATVALTKGENVFVIKAVDNSISRNTAEHKLTIYIESDPGNIDFQIPAPTITPDAEYNNWILTQPPEYRNMTFSDIDYSNFKYDGEGEITLLKSANTMGKPDIPCYAIKYKIPDGMMYDSYKEDIKESEPIKMQGYVKPVFRQFPLPAGGRPYVLPDKEEYGMQSGPIVSGKKDVNRPKSTVVSGGNPYKWPPALYNENNNEVIIYVNPARYNKDNKTLTTIKELKLKIKTKHKSQLLSNKQAIQINPQGLEIQRPYDMCIISNKRLIGTEDGRMDDFADYALMRTQKGIITKCVDIETIYQQFRYAGNDFEKLQHFLYNEKQQSKIKYALLGGETDIVPTAMVYAQTKDYKAIIPSDSFFSQSEMNWGKTKVNGIDVIGERCETLKMIPDLYVGRVPVENLGELKMYIDKMVRYYNFPYKSSYNKNALLIGNKLNDKTYGGDILDATVDQLPKTGMAYTRLYDNTIKNNNNYINYVNPDQAAMVINQIDPHLLVFECHGSPNQLDEFKKSQVDKIFNRNPGFITSTIACNANQYTTGYQGETKSNDLKSFEAEPSISESLLIKDNGGSLVFAGNTAYGWYCPERPDDGISDFYQKQFLKNLLLGSSVGEAFWNSKIMCYSCKNENIFDEHAWWVYNGFNLLGDPSFTPVFYGENSKVDKIELYPKLMYCNNLRNIKLNVSFKGLPEIVADPDNIQWSVTPFDAGELTVHGDVAQFRCKNTSKRIVITARYQNFIAFCFVLPEKTVFNVKISPQRCYLDVDSSMQFYAQIVDDTGYDYSDYFVIKWLVDDEAIGSIDKTGFFRLKRLGKCTVMAICEELNIGWVAYVNHPILNNNTHTFLDVPDY